MSQLVIIIYEKVGIFERMQGPINVSVIKHYKVTNKPEYSTSLASAKIEV